jgi:uncharacterized protein (TIGR03118 family)
MRIRNISRRAWLFSVAALLAALSLLILPTVTFAQANANVKNIYQQTNLVSNKAGEAPVTDPNLDNAWGLAAGPTTPWWVNDNDTGLSTLYNAQGQIVPLVVTVPDPLNSPAGMTSSPSGIVFNGTSGFVVNENGTSGAALFIFDTEDGTISAWNPNVDLTHAILTVDRSKVGQGAVYKGLAIATDKNNNTDIFATNFRFGTIEEFNSNFQLIRSFTDPVLAHDCPLLHQCFAPFGIQTINNQLFVTFALQDKQKENDVAGHGLGFVDVFNTNGQLVRRLIAGDGLNAPWGLALAPANFGHFSNDLLVANFGDGHIHAFDPKTGVDLGQPLDSNGKPIVIPGLWALEFGNGAAANGATNQLFFTDGPDGHGLFGFIESQD